jgi:hypothetical protein
MAVPASPPLQMTILASLDDRCDECRLPVYRLSQREARRSVRESSPAAELILPRCSIQSGRKPSGQWYLSLNLA